MLKQSQSSALVTFASSVLYCAPKIMQRSFSETQTSRRTCSRSRFKRKKLLFSAKFPWEMGPFFNSHVSLALGVIILQKSRSNFLFYNNLLLFFRPHLLFHFKIIIVFLFCSLFLNFYLSLTLFFYNIFFDYKPNLYSNFS